MISYLSSFCAKFLPSPQQVVRKAIEWNQERINIKLAQGISFLIIMLLTFAITQTLIAPCPINSSFFRMLYELAVKVVVVQPLVRGYAPIGKRISQRLVKVDPMARIDQMVDYWNSSESVSSLGMVSVPVVYFLVYTYQEWIGRTLGGLMVYQALKFSLYCLMIFYSDLIYRQLIKSVTAWIKQPKVKIEQAPGMVDLIASYRRPEDDDQKGASESTELSDDQFEDLSDVLSEEESDSNVLTWSVRDVLKQSTTGSTTVETHRPDSPLPVPGEDILDGSFFRKLAPGAPNPMSDKMRAKVEMYEDFQKKSD